MTTRPQAFVHTVTFWFVAPILPSLAGIVAQALGASDRTILTAMEIVSACLALALLLASLWGAAEIEKWLEKEAPPFMPLVVAPLLAAYIAAGASQIARSSIVFQGEGLPTSATLAVFPFIWATLIAYQAKPFWDYAKSAWRKEGARVFWRGTPGYGAYVRRRALQRRRQREALAWRAAQTVSPLPTPERARLEVWLEDPQNRRAFRKVRPRPNPMLVLLLAGLFLLAWAALLRAIPSPKI